VILFTTLSLGAPGIGAQGQIDATNWGSVTAPVFGSSEAGIYAGAELFAGANKFGGNYFHGVLPNGRIVRPAGISIQIGMNPLGAALTPDGKYLITSNDDERNATGVASNSLLNSINRGGYSLSVIDTATMTVASQINTAGRYFIGLQATGNGPYTVWASGGADQNMKVFALSAAGVITGPTTTITIPPIKPQDQKFVSNYTPMAGFNTDAVPTNFSAGGAKTTFPAGSALSPDNRYLYVACNGDNGLAVIDTATQTVVKQVPVGYFPYGVAVSRSGTKVLVSNWGVTEYKFVSPHYDAAGNLTALDSVPGNQPDGFYLPPTSTTGTNPQTSSISLVAVPGGSGRDASPLGAIYMGHPLDALYQVGDTHPSAMAVVRRGALEVLYVTKANSDSLGLILINNNRRLPDFDLSPIRLTLLDGHQVHGAYPNAIVVSSNNTRAYVAEAGLNAVAVLDTTDPTQPRLIGRIPTGWYPTGLALSHDGRFLYVINAKGIGEDINPKTTGNPTATGQQSFADSNYLFGSLQKIDLAGLNLDNTTVLGYNFAVHTPADTSVVPIGGPASTKIKHVFFVLHENKTFDSMLGNLSAHFGPYASLTYNNPDGSAFTSTQNTGVSLNTQLLATTFATAVNDYSDSEESDAGHQFCMSGTASDYTEKTLLVKGGRGLLVNKNFEQEDYPEGGYIFNNAARNGVDFRIYGIEAARIIGSDTGTSVPTTLNDPLSGLAGAPKLNADGSITSPLVNQGDVNSDTRGVGQSFYMKFPGLAVLGMNNPSGEGRIDLNYPGYNFNISDQRRALEFCKDFDRMAAGGALPKYLYIYQPNDHTGSVQAPGFKPTGAQLIADGDVALGMVVDHIMKSKAYYDPDTGEGGAIFVTYDDAQSSMDHIHTHRTPLIVVSPYAKPGYIGKRHYVTASVVKTEELLLGLPPNNLGDLFATDLRDLFQSDYNGITADSLTFNRLCLYTPSPEGRKVWALVTRLDTSAPDLDSRRLGALNRLSMAADWWHREAEKRHRLHAPSYRKLQARLYACALAVVSGPTPRDLDD
jgi:YVTN family beta-propeller protein